MGWDTGLADRVRRKGVRVVEVAGWQTRGSVTYEPALALHHHTAGPARGATPSLAVCIYGRSDVPGPLCQVLQSREPDGDDIAYVIAAGKANHGGKGAWRGVSGNSRAGGVEVEHVGTTTVDDRRIEVTCRILAAILEGGSRDARNVCQHFEYALPKGRKIDFALLGTWSPDRVRQRTGYWIGRVLTGPAPTPPQEDDMPLTDAEYARIAREAAKATVDEMHRRIDADAPSLRHGIGNVVAGQLVIAREADTENKPFLAWAGSGPVYVVDGDRQTKRLVSGWANVDREVFLGALANGVFTHTDGREHPQPYVFEQAWLDSIDTVEPDAHEPAEPPAAG